MAEPADKQHDLADAAPQRSHHRMSSFLNRTFAKHLRGRLEIETPSKSLSVLGAGETTDARVVLKNWTPLWRLATRGSLGLAESYMRCEINTDNLEKVLRFGHKNFDALHSAAGGLLQAKRQDVSWHRKNANTKQGSQRNIAAHYDLGNSFYASWLDPSMTYSSALYRSNADTLEAAQKAKNSAILDYIDLKSGNSVLEIGCGWGGFAEAACRRGARVTGLTISNEQLAYARGRLANAGFAAQSDIRYQDYRDSEGVFDKIASIEMIEAVGEENWPHYFSTIAARLRPGGTAAIQAITIDEKYFATYRCQADFIQRYIFPGGLLPTVSKIREHARNAGLIFEIAEQFSESYVKTLQQWRQSFASNWPEIGALGFDERFRRMWEYYLTYCQIGFQNQDISVGIYRLKKI